MALLAYARETPFSPEPRVLPSRRRERMFSGGSRRRQERRGNRFLTGQVYTTVTGNVGERFDFYVDQSATSNGAGTKASPFTAAQMTALSGTISGKRIGIKRGTDSAGAVKPTITLTDNYLIVGLYGSGAGPIFDLRKTITGSWTNVGTNLWSNTWTQESDGSASGNIFRNDIPMKLVQTTPAADGEAVVAVWNWSGVRGITATTSGSVTIYSTVDPTGDGYTYKASAWLYGLNLSGNNVRVEGAPSALITTKGSLHQGGGHRYTGTGNTIRYVRGEHGSRHCMIVGANAVIEDSQFYGGRNRQENGAADHIVCNQTAFAGTETAVIRRTTFAGDTYLVAGEDSLSPFYSHDNGSGALLTATIEDCTFGSRMAGIAPRAQTTTVTRPVYSSAWEMVTEGADTATISFTSATGTVGRMLAINNGSGTLTFNTTSCVLTLDGSRFTTGQHFQIRQEGGGTLVWNSTGDALTCSDPTGTLRYISLVNKFTFAVNGSSFPGTWDKMYAVYGTMNFTGNNNNYKSGADKFETPAGNDNTLSAWKTRVSPQDAASTATA